jgi:hypothetical protein
VASIPLLCRYCCLLFTFCLCERRLAGICCQSPGNLLVHVMYLQNVFWGSSLLNSLYMFNERDGSFRGSPVLKSQEQGQIKWCYFCVAGPNDPRWGRMGGLEPGVGVPDTGGM